MQIPIKLIDDTGRLRPVTEKQVENLVASIRDVGLLNPVTVIEAEVMAGGSFRKGWRLVAGAHRLEAARRLGWSEIEAHVIKASDLEAKLAECDENLVASVLSPSERALLTDLRKHFYEELHPETRLGATGVGREKVRQLGEPNAEPAERFTADTAAKTGRSERDVQRDAQRGANIPGDVLQEVQGTELDKGVVLDKLAASPDPKAALEAIRREQDQEEAKRRNKQMDRDAASQSAEEFADWLFEVTEALSDKRPTIITWLMESKARDIAAALRRLMVATATA